MSPRLAALFALLTVVHSPLARAEGRPEAAPAAAATRSAPGLWGVELDAVQPFIPEVHIFTLKATRTLWGREGGPRGEAVVGVYARPNVKHNVVDEIDEYLSIVGYRQYFWRGLHAEALSYQGWARGTRNKLDGKNYSDVAWLAEVSAGYRVAFADAGPLQLYVTPQAGYLVGVHTNIGPRETPDRFITAKLLVGARF